MTVTTATEAAISIAVAAAAATRPSDGSGTRATSSPATLIYRILADAIERGLGRVECVELTRQYLHLSPLVDIA